MEETVKIEIGYDKIRVALEAAADNLFKSSYDNPIANLLNKSIQDKSGELKKIVDEIIISSINSSDFKTKMADVVIQKMVENSLRK